MSKISIVIPIYNAENTLERCVDSIVGQTYENIEIILVNDGSRDSSLEICRRYEKADDRIIVIDKINGGVSSARNAGLDIAQGEFVMFCDSDDWAEPEWCEELISHYEADCFVMCGHFIEGEQSVLPHEIKAEHDIEYYEKYTFPNLKLKSFKVPWNKIYARNTIEKRKLRFEERLSNGEDYLFNVQYLSSIAGKIIFLDKCVFHYAWPGNESLSGKVPRNYSEQCDLLFEQISQELNNFREMCSEEKRKIVADFFYEYEKCIISIAKNNNANLKSKLKMINHILEKNEYHMCAKVANISSNPIYSFLCRRKKGLGLLLWLNVDTLRRK